MQLNYKENANQPQRAACAASCVTRTILFGYDIYLVYCSVPIRTFWGRRPNSLHLHYLDIFTLNNDYWLLIANQLGVHPYDRQQ